ncbi:unnamed protein product, partial [marine sediment metagenome]
AWLCRQGNRALTLRLEPRGGGGETVSQEYKTIQREKARLCLCIVDSDSKYAGAPLGMTAKHLMALDQPSSPLCQCVVLRVMETENLVPVGVYERASGRDPARKAAVWLLCRMDEAGISDARKYYDMKRGLRMEKLEPGSRAPAFREYWLGVLSAMGVQLADLKQSGYTYGFGDRILRDVIEQLLLRNGPKEIDSLVCAALRPEWDRVGQCVAHWCCGMPAMVLAGA